MVYGLFFESEKNQKLVFFVFLKMDEKKFTCPA